MTDFAKEVSRPCLEYKKRDTTRLVPLVGRAVIDNTFDAIEIIMYHTYLYEDGGPQSQYIRLADNLDIVSGDILCQPSKPSIIRGIMRLLSIRSVR